MWKKANKTLQIKDGTNRMANLYLPYLTKIYIAYRKCIGKTETYTPEMQLNYKYNEIVTFK